jgi:hypothetical protein
MQRLGLCSLFEKKKLWFIVEKRELIPILPSKILDETKYICDAD